jgi:hypothetical protein
MPRVKTLKPPLTETDVAMMEWLDTFWSTTFKNRARATIRFADGLDDAVTAFRMAVTRDWSDTTFTIWGRRFSFTEVNFRNVVENLWSSCRRGNQRKMVQVFMVQLSSRYLSVPTQGYFFVLATDDPNYYNRAYRHSYNSHNVLSEFTYQPETKAGAVQKLLELRDALRSQGARIEMDVKIGNLKLDGYNLRPYYMYENI